ncbi:hypothetical protein NX059_010403 [Plenodomus lindquistii]|nr:hypothetical protein NX059_010403 [Plenodomus lindquistii]
MTYIKRPAATPTQGLICDLRLASYTERERVFPYPNTTTSTCRIDRSSLPSKRTKPNIATMSDKQEEEKPQHQHIQTEPKDDDEQDQDQDQGTGGLLSKIGDPAGKVLGTALRPLGAPLEKGLTGPLGNALGGTTRGALGPLMGTEEEKSELLGGKNKDSYAGEEKLGGREQTGENPLGLDQSGRWGFEEEGGAGGAGGKDAGKGAGGAGKGSFF